MDSHHENSPFKLKAFFAHRVLFSRKDNQQESNSFSIAMVQQHVTSSSCIFPPFFLISSFLHLYFFIYVGQTGAGQVHLEWVQIEFVQPVIKMGPLQVGVQPVYKYSLPIRPVYHIYIQGSCFGSYIHGSDSGSEFLPYPKIDSTPALFWKPKTSYTWIIGYPFATLPFIT